MLVNINHKILTRLLIGIGGLFFLSSCPQAIAQPVRSGIISPDVTELSLYPDTSVTLDWTQTDRIIETVFLSNSTTLIVGSDGCLSGLSNVPCKQNRASALNIKLRQPRTFIRSTLTVVTIDPTGKRKTQVYSLLRGKKYGRDDEINLIQYSASAPPPSLGSIKSSQALLLRKGLSTAQARRWALDPLLISKSQLMINYVEQGMSLEDAAAKARVSLPYAQKLISIGEQR
jgi:hypothetical protein